MWWLMVIYHATLPIWCKNVHPNVLYMICFSFSFNYYYMYFLPLLFYFLYSWRTESGLSTVFWGKGFWIRVGQFCQGYSDFTDFFHSKRIWELFQNLNPIYTRQRPVLDEPFWTNYSYTDEQQWFTWSYTWTTSRLNERVYWLTLMFNWCHNMETAVECKNQTKIGSK